MTTFFRQTAQAMIAKHIDRFPLLKLDQVIDWQPIEQYLNRQRTCYLRDHRGRPASQQKNHPNKQTAPTKKTIRNASDRSGLFSGGIRASEHTAHAHIDLPILAHRVHRRPLRLKIKLPSVFGIAAHHAQAVFQPAAPVFEFLHGRAVEPVADRADKLAFVHLNWPPNLGHS
ncbi:IS1106 transposase [Neisseria meningitidis]|nr:IS1106 transposase [Neisseria meningitidis]SPY10351.1 IS1106 transposase [Neisseria meningitidis]